MVLAARRRHALLALAAALSLLAVPVLHPGAWAHRGLERGSEIVELAAGAAGAPIGLEDHLRCPLCRVLAQARSGIASPTLSAVAAPVLAASVSTPHAAPLPAAPALASLRARAPPSA